MNVIKVFSSVPSKQMTSPFKKRILCYASHKSCIKYGYQISCFDLRSFCPTKSKKNSSKSLASIIISTPHLYEIIYSRRDITYLLHHQGGILSAPSKRITSPFK
mmetsp:Transcript_2054/g.3899  ORF Transcript_2054/g.3899 Transcript_2054/m.3899 type:complete len:104 (+) Transcript_2054:38-349(+)